MAPVLACCTADEKFHRRVGNVEADMSASVGGLVKYAAESNGRGSIGTQLILHKPRHGCEIECVIEAVLVRAKSAPVGLERSRRKPQEMPTTVAQSNRCQVQLDPPRPLIVRLDLLPFSRDIPDGL